MLSLSSSYIYSELKPIKESDLFSLGKNIHIYVYIYITYYLYVYI